MVGVGGRSKACLACYRRRIKCDEARPTCARCQKARIECPGYKDTYFVSFEAGEKGLERVGTPKPAQGQKRSLHQAEISLPLNTKPVTLHQDDLCISYARAHLPLVWCRTSQWKLAVAVAVAVDASSNLKIQANIVQYTLISLARTLFGYRFQQPDLLKEGFSLYRQVLSALQQALAQTESLHRTEILEAVLALRAFDSFIPYHSGAWIQHSIGLEKLLQVKGPCGCQDPKSRELLERARPLVILACLRVQRNTILASEEWKSVPWAQKGTLKSFTERLIDTFLDLPTILYGAPKLSTKTVPDRRSKADIQADAILMIERLQTWRRDWMAHRAFHTIEDGIGDAVVNSRELFDAEGAQTLALYIAICMITIFSTFREELEDVDTVACSQHDLFSGLDRTPTRSSKALDATSAAIQELYHKLIGEAYHMVIYLLSNATPQLRLIEILVPLRHVWMATRFLKCSIAVQFDRAMRQIMTHPTSGLPLYLHVED